MHRFSVNNSSAYGRAITESPGLGHRHRPILCHARNKNIPVDTSDQAIGSVTKPRGTFDHRVEHRLNIGGRPRNHAQDLACSGLLLQGFGKLVFARFEQLSDTAQLFFALAQFSGLRIVFLLCRPKPSHRSSPKIILRELYLANREEAGKSWIGSRTYPTMNFGVNRFGDRASKTAKQRRVSRVGNERPLRRLAVSGCRYL